MLNTAAISATTTPGVSSPFFLFSGIISSALIRRTDDEKPRPLGQGGGQSVAIQHVQLCDLDTQLSIGQQRRIITYSNRKVYFSIGRRRRNTAYSNKKLSFSIGQTAESTGCSNIKVSLSIGIRRDPPACSNRKVYFYIGPRRIASVYSNRKTLRYTCKAGFPVSTNKQANLSIEARRRDTP
jgi:hypothetical protein